MSDIYERKVINCKHTNNGYILNFIRSINNLHMNLSNQLNSNNVALGTKTHTIAKNRF